MENVTVRVLVEQRLSLDLSCSEWDRLYRLLCRCSDWERLYRGLCTRMFSVTADSDARFRAILPELARYFSFRHNKFRLIESKLIWGHVFRPKRHCDDDDDDDDTPGCDRPRQPCTKYS